MLREPTRDLSTGTLAVWGRRSAVRPAPIPRGARSSGALPYRVVALALVVSVAVLAGACSHLRGDLEPIDCDQLAISCTQCHGSGANPAPPRSTDDASDTSEVTVGAHQSHLNDGSIRAAIRCEECHIVPATVNQEGHLDFFPAEVIWGELATTGDSTPTWDRRSATCSDTYCHGVTLAGGSNKIPTWTTVDGTQAACGTCHGAPPPWPHPGSSNCASCHPQTMDGSQIDIAGGFHINGTLEVSGLACNSCHGSEDNPAPPLDTSGLSDTGEVTVGAHQAHMNDGPLRQALECSECHKVPGAPEDEGHIDPSPAELIWGTLATTGDSTPTWDRGSATCSDTYCHGVTLGGGSNKTPTWTTVDGSQAACGTCHGAPPPLPHPGSSNCEGCHSQTMDGSQIDVAGGFHIDGIVQVEVSGDCDACHGAPPATGSHLVHYGGSVANVSYGGTGITADLLPSGGGYAFDCGNCHPTDPSHHMNGVLNAGGGQAEVDLSPTGAPPGSLKARNSGAAIYTPGSTLEVDGSGFSYTLGSCDGVYCHSSRQVETPSGVPEPGVDFVFGGYPISYPSFPLDVTRRYETPTWGESLSCDGCHGFPPRAESLLVEAAAGDSHSFIDVDGFEDLHGYNHGGDPLPCATCHHDTVTDPGVRWRDYVAPANGWSVYEPVPIDGYLAHVNGLPDVAFTTESATVMTTAFDLSGATWDASSLSCDSVGCHLLQTQVVWGTPYRYDNVYECNACHQM